MDNKTSTTRARIDLGARRSSILRRTSSILRKPQPSRQTLSYRSHSTRDGVKIYSGASNASDQRNNLIRNRSRKQKADSSLSLSLSFPSFLLPSLPCPHFPLSHQTSSHHTTVQETRSIRRTTQIQFVLPLFALFPNSH